MDYEKLYNEALERAKQFHKKELFAECNGRLVEYIFPELKESEDERIRKEIIDYIKIGTYHKDWLTWLEKQGEQKVSYTTTVETGDGGINALVTKDIEIPFGAKDSELQEATYFIPDGCYAYIDGDKVIIKRPGKTKFKVGDWVVLSTSDGEKVVQIDSIEYFKSGEPRYITFEGRWFGNGTKARLWTIQDAKNGDVLYHISDNGIEYIVMTKGINRCNNVDSYFRYNSIDGFAIDIPSVLSAKDDSITPADKKQRDFLFQKMKEAGYEWSYKDRKLIKIVK